MSKKRIISEAEYRDLLKDNYMLSQLFLGGVDNWEGFGDALERFRKWESEEYSETEDT